jgi:hypothetical protein
MPHCDPVIDTDRVELKRYAARSSDDLFDAATELLQVNMAGDDIDIRVDDSDERLVEVFIAQTGRFEQCPVGRSFITFFDAIGAHAIFSAENKKTGLLFGQPRYTQGLAICQALELSKLISLGCPSRNGALNPKNENQEDNQNNSK